MEREGRHRKIFEIWEAGGKIKREKIVVGLERKEERG